jgi:hypothetical protein
MLIELDLTEAKRLNITANQFILISLLINKIKIPPVMEVLNITELDIENLIEQNILTKESIYSSKFDKLFIAEEFTDKFKTKDFFLEFYDIYPPSVTRSDGIRDYLRGDVSRCRKYYEKIVGKSTDKHEAIMEALKFEVETRKRNGNSGYMKRMAKWLLSEEWLTYEEFIKDKKVQKHAETIYGTTIE